MNTWVAVIYLHRVTGDIIDIAARNKNRAVLQECRHVTLAIDRDSDGRREAISRRPKNVSTWSAVHQHGPILQQRRGMVIAGDCHRLRGQAERSRCRIVELGCL